MAGSAEKLLAAVFLSCFLWTFSRGEASEYDDLLARMNVASREGTSETLEIITDSATPEVPGTQTAHAYIFHLLMERQPPVAELCLRAGFFMPLKKNAKAPVVHNVYFHIDGNRVPREIIGTASTRTVQRDKGEFVYVDLGVEEALIRRIADSRVTRIEFVGLSIGLLGMKDKPLGKIDVTVQEKEAIKRVVRLHELLLEEYGK